MNLLLTTTGLIENDIFRGIINSIFGTNKEKVILHFMKKLRLSQAAICINIMSLILIVSIF